MTRITFLGTAGSTPTKFRNLPSLALEHNGEVFLFDCGEGTQKQMMIYSVNVSKVKAIFLTHIHGDHTIGIAGLIRTLALNRRTEPLYIFIPESYEKNLQDLISFDRAIIKYKIIIKPINSAFSYKGKDFEIRAFKLLHTVSTYGFVFKEHDKLRFIKPKIKQLGLKGKMFKQILSKKSIKINNKTYKLSDLTVKSYGKKIVYATDTRPTKETVKAALNADILIHEATYDDSKKELAKERFHSTTLETALTAKRAGVKRLVITHLSARYRDSNILIKEARTIFKNTEIAEDGLIINI